MVVEIELIAVLCAVWAPEETGRGSQTEWYTERLEEMDALRL